MDESKEVVKFYYGLTTEQYKHVVSILESERKKRKKETTTLVATNAVVLILLLSIWNHLK